MWSLGIMLYQLYARRFPYWKTYEQCRHAKLDEVAELVADHPIRFDYGPWLAMSSQGREFMERCLIRDYGQRMTVTEALNHDWLNQWLPEDDLSGLDVSLESMGTSSDDEDLSLMDHQRLQQAYAHIQQQQQQRLQLAQQHAVASPQQQVQQRVQQQQHQKQKQHQVVLAPEQMQQRLLGQSFDPAQLVGQGPGAYSSSSATGGTAGNGASVQHHHQQQDGNSSSPSMPVVQQPAAAAASTNNSIIVPGSRQQQQQQQAESAAAAVGSRKGQQ